MCCGAKPIVKLIRNPSLSFVPFINWKDGRCVFPRSRVIRWQFFVNGVLRYSTAFATPLSSLPIGTGSTYSSLNATNGQITDYLGTLGITVNVGDFVGVRVEIRNCDRETATSNTILFVAESVGPACLCDFSRTYSIGSGTITPSPGGQVAFINGLLNATPLVNPVEAGDEFMVLALSGLCGDTFQVNAQTNQTGNVTVPAPFLAAVPNAANWIVARNGQIQSTYSPVLGFTAITPVIPSEPSDEWLFVGLTGGDCAFVNIAGSSSASGTSLALPAQLSAANAAKWLPVKNGLAMYAAGNSVSGYSVSGNTITFEDALAGDEIWYIFLD